MIDRREITQPPRLTEHPCGCVLEPHPDSPTGLRRWVKRCEKHPERVFEGDSPT